MRKIRVLLLILVFIFTISSIALAEEEWTGNVNFFLGAKTLDKEDWEPVEDQNELGIEVDFAKKTWPVNISIDIMGSSAEETTILGVKVEGKTSELNFGVRKIFDVGSMHPFVGGGIAFIDGEFTIPGFYSTSADATGYWLAAGIYWALTEHFNLGLEAKHSSADATFDVLGTEKEVDVGGEHFGLLLGYHW